MSKQINTVILEGVIVETPDLKTSKKGKDYVVPELTNSYEIKGNDVQQTFPCLVFLKENSEEFVRKLVKGTRLLISGFLRSETKESDSKKFTSISVQAYQEGVEILSVGEIDCSTVPDCAEKKPVQKSVDDISKACGFTGGPENFDDSDADIPF